MVDAMDEKKDEENNNVESVGSLENESLKRKERLKALRQQKTFKTKTDEEVAFPKPIFRNYTPNDSVLKPGVLPKPNLINIEEQIRDQLENAKPEPLVEKEIDLATLAPQKIDWDLKREAEKKLKMLEKKTQAAITELIKDRLQKSKNPDFAELVSVGTKNSQVTTNNADEDED